MKLHEIDKVREHAGVMVVLFVVARNTQVVVIEDEPFHVRDVVIALTPDLPDVVIAHVDDGQVRQVINGTEYIPGQLGHIVAGPY